MSKRFLSMLLAVVMVVSMLPVTAFAGTASDAKEEISGVVDNVLDGVDFYYNDKVGVSMNFGSALNPNTLLADYDVKAMGAVKLTKVGTDEGDKLHADGEVYLHVPYSVFTKAYDAAAEMAMESLYDAKIKEKLAGPYSETRTVTKSETVTIPKAISELPMDLSFEVVAAGTATISGTLAEVIETLLNPTAKHTVELTWSFKNSDLNTETYLGYLAKAVQAGLLPSSVDINYRSELVAQTQSIEGNENLTEAEILKGFLVTVADRAVTLSDDETTYAKDQWAAAVVNEYDSAATSQAANEVIETRCMQLASAAAVVLLKQHSNFALKMLFKSLAICGTDYCFKTASAVRTEIKNIVLNNIIIPSIDGDVQSFYGNLFEPLNQTLTSRFEKLEAAIDDLVDTMSGYLGNCGCTSGSECTCEEDKCECEALTFEIPLPIDKIGLIEGMLKSAVATLNGTNADDEFINGAILGYNDTDTLPTKEDTGIYIVAGVNSADIDDMAFQAHVIAPDLVRVEILGDADGDGTKYDYADKGIFMQTTVGDAYNVKSTVNGTYNESDYEPKASNLMQLRIDGLTTEGTRYAAHTDEGDQPLSAPENAGVYTVLSIYLDSATLAMGADIAVLVVEPAKTAEADFTFVDDLTVPYDTFGHYPELTDKTGHATIKGAVNKEKKEAYILLKGFDVDSNVDAQVENVEQILDALNKEAEKLHLPTANLTSQAMEAVAKLANFAKTKAEEAEDGGILTGQEVINYKNSLLSYLENQKTKYSEANLKAMSSKAYKAALDSIAQIEAGVATNPTIQQYTALIGTMLDAFEELTDQAAATPEAISTFALDSEETSTVTEIAASTTSNSNEKVKLLAEKVLNTLLAKSGVNDNNVSAVVNSVLNYVGGVDDEVINSKYYDDAVALVKTMGAAAGADDTTVAAAVQNVTEAFTVMYSEVLGLAKDAVNAHLTDGDKVYTLESIKAKVDELTKAEVKTLAAGVLSKVSAFVSTVMDEAKKVVDNTDWTVKTVYFNIEPSEVGTYNCYAVNVNPNYVPNLTQAELEILETVTVVAKPQEINKGEDIAQGAYEVKDHKGNVITLDGIDVTLTVEKLAELAAGTYEGAIKVTVNTETMPKGYVLDTDEPTVPGDLTIIETECQHPETKTVKENEVGTSCTEAGSYDSVVYCSVCDEELSRETITVEAKGHDWGTEADDVKENIVDPTCCEKGSYDSVRYCKVCGVELIRNPVTVETILHQDTSGDGKCDLICNKNGENTVCGVAVCTHVEGDACVEVLEAVEPDCTSAGRTKGLYCNEHEQFILTPEEKAPLGHKPGSAQLEDEVDANCIDPGYREYATYCTRTGCGEEVDRWTVTIPARGYHVDENDDHKCDDCGTDLCVEHPAVVVEKENVISATCTAGGSYDEVKYCAECKEKLSTEHITVPATGHKDENGDNRCDVCGTSLCGANNHDWVAGTTVPNNCGNDGYTIYTCSACGDSKRGDIVPATGDHDYGTTPKEYDRDSSGHGLRCKVCGKWGEWEPHTFEVSEDKLTKTCEHCGYTIRKRIVYSAFEQEHIAESLKATYSTVEQIKTAMESKIPTEVEVVESVLQNVVLQYYDEEAKEWFRADEEHFPEGGLEVSLPVPDGFNAEEHTIYVTHLCETTKEIEVFSVGNGLTIENGMLVFTVQSLSPVDLIWGNAEEEEPEDYGTAYNKTTYQIKLIEPWALRVNVRVTDASFTTIDYSKVNDYGVYAIRRSLLSDPNADIANMTIETLKKEANVKHFTKAAGNATQGGNYITFIFEDGLFTYRLKDDVVWVLYYETDEGTYVTAVQERNLFDLMNERKDSTSATYGAEEKQVYADMVELYNKVTDYRSDFDNLRDMELQNTDTMGTTDISFGSATTDGEYGFARVQQIGLIEPWGMRLNTRIYTADDTNGVVDYTTLSDYGVIVFHDKEKAVAAEDMDEYTELLNYDDKSNVYVFSKSQGTTEISGRYAASNYNKEIFTYEMDSTLYYMFFAKDGENFYYSQVYATNIRQLADDRSTSTSSTYTEKEKKTYAAMVDLCDSVTEYREWYYENHQ